MTTTKPTRKKAATKQLDLSVRSIDEIRHFFSELTPKQARDAAISVGIMTVDGGLTAKFRVPNKGARSGTGAQKKQKADPWAAFRPLSEEEIRRFYSSLTQEDALRAGVRAGIFTPSGRLTASYRQPKAATKKGSVGTLRAATQAAAPERKSPEVAELEKELRRHYPVDPENAVRAAKRAGILTPTGKLSKTCK